MLQVQVLVQALEAALPRRRVLLQVPRQAMTTQRASTRALTAAMAATATLTMKTRTRTTEMGMGMRDSRLQAQTRCQLQTSALGEAAQRQGERIAAVHAAAAELVARHRLLQNADVWL